MTKRLILRQVGLIRQTSARAELEPVGHPAPGGGHYPRDFETDQCVGVDHLTYTIIPHWQNTSGVFDPYSLYNAILKRLDSVEAEVTQSGLGLNVGTYNISLTGAGLITFHDGGDYEWSSGSMIKQERLVDQSATVIIKSTAPTSVTIRLENDIDELSAISITDNNGVEQLINHDFTQFEEHFYDIDSWHDAAIHPEIVPTDVLGYLQGYNQHILYTVFE